MSNEVLNYDKIAEASLAKAQRDGAETMWDRRAAQKTQCGFGEAGVCCRICTMGPCRVSPVPGKGAERGICGANADTIVARNFARMCAAGTSAQIGQGISSSSVRTRRNGRRPTATGTFGLTFTPFPSFT